MLSCCKEPILNIIPAMPALSEIMVNTLLDVICCPRTTLEPLSSFYLSSEHLHKASVHISHVWGQADSIWVSCLRCGLQAGVHAASKSTHWLPGRFSA